MAPLRRLPIQAGQYAFMLSITHNKVCHGTHTLLTPRLHAPSYRPSKAQRRALSRLYWELSGRTKPSNWKGKWGVKYNLEEHLALVLNDDDIQPACHPPYFTIPIERIHVSLKRATATDEKYALFRRYQAAIHHEAEEEISSRSGWEDFLVHTPFPDSDPDTTSLYGIYHYEYRCMCLLSSSQPDRERLIAVGVIDLLPLCVSSVYFFYDPDFAAWELGKISAMAEIGLAQRLCKKYPSLSWYYLGTFVQRANEGYYVHTCQKMVYKSTFQPCELLDTYTNKWFALDQRLRRLLNNGQRANFNEANSYYAQTWPVQMPFRVHGISATLPSPTPLGYMHKSEVLKHAAEWLVLDLTKFPPALTTLQVRS